MSVVSGADCRVMMMMISHASDSSLVLLDREVCCISVTTTVVKLTVKVMMIALLIDTIG